MKRVEFRELGRMLGNELDLRVMPFWRKHAVDEEQGGLFTCLDEAGQVLSPEKYL